VRACVRACVRARACVCVQHDGLANDFRSMYKEWAKTSRTKNLFSYLLSPQNSLIYSW